MMITPNELLRGIAPIVDFTLSEQRLVAPSTRETSVFRPASRRVFERDAKADMVFACVSIPMELCRRAASERTLNPESANTGWLAGCRCRGGNRREYEGPVLAETTY
jgi:hypothetical protein